MASFKTDSRQAPATDDRRSALARWISDALGGSGIDDPLFGDELEKQTRTHGDRVYSDMIHSVCSLELEPSQARLHWLRIVEHRHLMQQRLGTSVDLRVALASYFVDVCPTLRRPKIVDAAFFDLIRESAYRDALTGLHNYRFFREFLNREVQRSTRTAVPLSLVMLDIDDFKPYNDRNGHQAGNEALSEIGGLLTAALRPTDIAARYGGEEFALLLPMTAKLEARRIAEDVCDRIGRRFADDALARERGPLTASLGVATCPADTECAEELVRNADLAMYEAKHDGKNRIRLFGNSSRSYPRQAAVIDGRFRSLERDYRSMTTVDLHAGGMLFRTDNPPPVGAPVEIKLSLPGTAEVEMIARVARVEPREDGEYAIGVQTVAMSERQRSLLARWLDPDPDAGPGNR